MITGQITEQEFIGAHYLHRRQLAARIKLVALLVFALGLVLYVAVSNRWGVILMCAALGGLLGEFVQNKFILPAKLRRLYAQVRGRVDITYSWDGEKLFFATERAKGARPWADFPKAKENDELLLLYINDVLFEIISKRWFGDARALDDFRAHLHFVS